jgi:hypothetical protein
MSHPVIDDTNPNEVKVKTVYKTVDRIVTETKKQIPILVDSLVLLTIAFWYFFFTGLAVLFNRKIPTEWLKIATKLSQGKIAKKIANQETIKKPSSIKVVDLETQRQIIPLTP